MNARTALRRLSPSVYRAAVRFRHGSAVTVLGDLPGRARAHRMFREGARLTIEVSGRQGLGGLLSNAGNALHAARLHGVDAALRFTSPTYAPSWGVDDWLECYFVRLGPRPENRPVCESRHVSAIRPPSHAQRPDLVWGALRIREEIAAGAAVAATGAFAAVHFRGSDKYLESPRVPAGAVLDAVELEMQRDGLDRVFVASDEPQFIDLAYARFGNSAFSLPVQAVAAADGTPPHFSNVAGEVKALEALTVMVVLARARLLVKTESLLSEWAATLTDDQRVVRVAPSPGRRRIAASGSSTRRRTRLLP